MNNVDISTLSYPLNNAAVGHIKIWQFSPNSGKTNVLYEAKNLIVKTGADVLASAVAGQANSGISHFYVGYSGNASFSLGAQPAITTDDTVASFPISGTEGYLRIPLAFPPAFLNETGYTGNVPYFTTFITNGTQWNQYGSQSFGTGSKLYALGLVNAQDLTSNGSDRLFSKVYFGPIDYDATHGLAITWGITFRAV